MIPGSGKIPWRRKWATQSSILAREIHRQRSLKGYSPQGRKRVRLDLVTEQQQNRLCFYLLAVVNSAGMNILIQASDHLFSVLLGIFQGTELLGHVVNSVSNSLRNHHAVFWHSCAILHSNSSEIKAV